jgi:hypothetical protein
VRSVGLGNGVEGEWRPKNSSANWRLGSGRPRSGLALIDTWALRIGINRLGEFCRGARAAIKQVFTFMCPCWIEAR